MRVSGVVDSPVVVWSQGTFEEHVEYLGGYMPCWREGGAVIIAFVALMFGAQGFGLTEAPLTALTKVQRFARLAS